MNAKKTWFNRFLMWFGMRLTTSAIYRRWPKEVADWKVEQIFKGEQSFPSRLSVNELLAMKYIVRQKRKGSTFVTSKHFAEHCKLSNEDAESALCGLPMRRGLVRGRRLMTVCSDLECHEPIDITSMLGCVGVKSSFQCDFCQTSEWYGSEDGWVEYLI